MVGVEDRSSSADDTSSDEDVGDAGANKSKSKPALREADRQALEGIGSDDEDEDDGVVGGKVWKAFSCCVIFNESAVTGVYLGTGVWSGHEARG